MLHGPRSYTFVADIPNTALREMRSLQELDHSNVLHLVEVFPQGSSLVLVLECMRCDMAEVVTAPRGDDVL
jgi:hypothetical protein